MAVAEAWRRTLPDTVPAVRSRGGLLTNLSALGFKVVELQITLSDIVVMDAPLILEMSLPNVVGKRFVAVTAVQGDRYFTQPAIVENSWLSEDEINEVWFGKALLPYIDELNIPLIDQPQVAGRAVADLQKLLNKLPSVDIPVSSVYDQPTIEHVTRFQRLQGLAPDGRVGAHTLFWLYRETEEGMPRLTAGEGS
jgi:general secretion pathway protein A